MGTRGWIAVLALAVGVFYGVGYFVSPNGGDVELKKMLEATKQVKSFRGASIGSGVEQKLWEVDCNRVIVHQHFGSSSDSSSSGRGDELMVGDVRYSREGSGGWENNGSAGARGAQWYCDNLARGTMSDLLPDMFTMIGHAMMEKLDKKTVSGVRCQDWKYSIQSTTRPQTGSICIGLEDHLPYELTSRYWGNATYSDYNKTIEFDAPDSILQSANSASTGN